MFTTLVRVALSLALYSVSALAQKQELGLTLGRDVGVDRHGTISGTSLRLGSSTALQADYEYRLLGGPVSVYLGVHLLANPLRSVTSSDLTLTRDVATLYLTPGIMVKAFPKGRVIPWATAGGGLALYEQSTMLLNNQRNPASRDVSHGAFTVGGGVDIPVWRFVAVRGEIRDYYTGSPSYNTPISGGQNNLAAGGGIVLRFGH